MRRPPPISHLALADYSVYFGNIADTLPPLLALHTATAVFCLCDTHTHQHCFPRLQALLPQAQVIVMPAGEAHKILDSCRIVWENLLQHHADRSALLLLLGGGVVGDLGAFAAATYKRGIRFIQIPTSLLAQTDASIGGKTGIDFGGIKNSIGLFQNPQAVCIDTQFLQTLPEKHWQNGYAEMLKHALIASSQQLDFLLHSDWKKNIDYILPQSLQIKQNIVERDPFEKGLRKCLNFGHTFGHALESYSLRHDTDPLLHGEAVAAGMRGALYLSERVLKFSPEVRHALEQQISERFGTYTLPATAQTELLDLLKNDKKNKNGYFNFCLLEKLGKAQWDCCISEQTIIETFNAIYF
ncbi:MAG: 3-dehydroquinate synthase [Sphingobacteriales bacterium]|nr:3-dehydroquinate synthase [Sphingobacteriales bacterium]